MWFRYQILVVSVFLLMSCGGQAPPGQEQGGTQDEALLSQQQALLKQEQDLLEREQAFLKKEQALLKLEQDQLKQDQSLGLVTSDIEQSITDYEPAPEPDNVYIHDELTLEGVTSVSNSVSTPEPDSIYIPDELTPEAVKPVDSQEPDNIHESNYTISQFEASYYSVASPDTALVRETVDQISINFAMNDIGQLDPADFVGVWEGTIEVFSSKETINANFSVRWGNVSLYIDDELVSDWSNSNKVIPVNLQKGTHSIRVELVNNWHTANFYVSLSQSTKKLDSEVHSALSGAALNGAKVLAVGAYESSDLHNKVVVSIPDTSEEIVLVLATYSPVHWVIDNPYDTPVSAVFVSARGGGLSSVDGVTQESTYFTDVFIYEDLPLNIYDIIDRQPDLSFYEYGASRFVAALGDITNPVPLNPYILSPFKANYFSESSSELIATDTVQDIAIEYSWDDFNGIDSQEFYATWDGSIEIVSISQIVSMAFSVSWSDVQLFVDGESIQAWSNSDKSFNLLLDQGVHTIRVVYHNNWHTTDFSVIFTP